jgi:hypothetical protein
VEVIKSRIQEALGCRRVGDAALDEQAGDESVEVGLAGEPFSSGGIERSRGPVHEWDSNLIAELQNC